MSDYKEYYKGQLNNLKPTEYGLSIQVSDGIYKTNNMNLNDDCIDSLIEYLQEYRKTLNNAKQTENT